jgi:O-antigen/teichoic acid export membrane protein
LTAHRSARSGATTQPDDAPTWAAPSTPDGRWNAPPTPDPSTADVEADEDSTDEAPSTVASVLKSAGVRILVLPFSAILGVVCTRLIIQNFGRATYAQYGLLVAIGALLPFADLGMSAAIMNAVGASDHPSRDDHVRKVLITSIRVLLCSASVLLLIDLVITAAGWWPAIMGDSLLPDSGPAAAAGVLAIIAITLPVAFGQRVLTGVGKNHVTIALLGLQTPVVLVFLLVIIRLGVTAGSYLPVVPYIVALVLSIAATVWAARLITPAIGTALRQVPRIRSIRGGKVLDTAWPMLIQMIALPVAMQTDRLVLSHVSTSNNLAEYNLASQMYLPVWQVVTAAGVALWPIFARARARGDRHSQSPVPLSAGFAGAAAAVCLFISIISPWLANVASNGEIEISRGLLLAFSVFMVCQAAKYPLGMFMTDAPGLRYQAFMIVIMVPINLGISIVLAQRLGAVGPIIGSTIGVFVFQFGANFVYVRRVLAKERV